MSTQQVDIPEELLSFLGESRLATRDTAAQVRAALALHLFLDGVVSIGKAAELAEVPRLEFEELIVEMGLPTVRYDLSDYEDDIRSFAEAERRKRTA
jgi:predicted HTH domain antitoxin